MKKKLLIGGGITALVAVIVVIAVFAQGENYFKGFFDPDFDFPTADELIGNYPDIALSDGPDFYVASDLANKTCDNDSNPIGSKLCPFVTIEDALTRMINSGNNGSTIYVAAGSYDGGANLIEHDAILKGGYNYNFSVQGGNSYIRRPMRFKSVNGQISGFVFDVQDGVTSAIKVINSSDITDRMEIFDNEFTNGFCSDDMVSINGENVVFRNNYFRYAKSRESLVKVLNNATVESNNFYKSIAGNGNEEGIISSNNGYVFNNLITNVLSGTSTIIYSKGNGSLIANNTIADNDGLIDFALNVNDFGRAINNLIINNGGEAIVSGEFSVIENNGVFETDINLNYLAGKNFTCYPNYQGTRTNDMTHYKLGDGSSCENKGQSLAEVTEDAFGTPRPQGSKYDVGFYEVPVSLINIVDDPLVVIPFDPAEPIEPVCGNGAVESGEECDDGNTVDGDGCDSDCQVEADPDPDPDPVPPAEEEVECGEWSDISSGDQEYDIWMYLCEKEIVKGNSDGTLRPESKLNRAELLALAFRASDHENVYNVNNSASDCFPDVADEWFAKYICTAKNKGFIEGYKDGKAKPERDVILAEGLKMFLGALDEPFDVSDSDCWYCDMVEEAGDDNYLPYSFSDPTQVGPIELTRRKAFNMLYRIMIYR